MNSTKYGCGPSGAASSGQDETLDEARAGRHRHETHESQDREKGSTLWFLWRRPPGETENGG